MTRKSGQFAKRTQASSQISKRIGWINGHVDLAMPLLYSQVKDALTQLGDNEAMRVLKNVERQAASIRDPTGYVIAAARRLSGSSPAAERSQGKKHRGKKALTDDAAAGDNGEGKHQDAKLPASDVGSDSDSAAAAQNDSAGTIDEEMSGLKEEPEDEGFSGDVKENIPSRHSDTAAPKKQKASALGHVRVRVDRRVKWLNANGGLLQEIGSNAVDRLASVGHATAMQILKRLEAATQLQDPEAFIEEEIQRNQNSAPEESGNKVEQKSTAKGKAKAKAAVSGQAAKKGKVIKKGLKAKGSSDSQAGIDGAILEKVRTRVAWLNRNAALQAELSFVKVGALLAKTGQFGAVMRILKTVEENCAEIRDPNGYVINAAKRIGSEPTGPPGRKEKSGERNSEQQLRGHVDWLNQEFLSLPLDYDKAAPLLLALSPTAAGDILRHLEEGAAEVRDPTGYVLAAARRELGRSAPEEPAAAAASPRAPWRSEREDEDKIRRRITWLNGHVALAAPLIYERVAAELMHAGYHTALEVLNSLEENVDNIRDPNAYVVASARRAAGGGTGGDRRPALALSGLGRSGPRSSGGGLSASSSEKLRRRIDWLNGNVCHDRPLDFDNLGPLLRLSLAEAMEILKHFEEEASTVNDPSSWIKAAARRVSRQSSAEAIAALPIPPPPPPRGPGPKARPQGLAAIGPDTATASRSSYSGAVRTSAKGSDGKGSANSRSASVALTGTVSPANGGLTFYGSYGGPEDKIRRRIEWLNGNVQLHGRVDWMRVMQPLLEVGQQQAMEVLRRLEEMGAEVRDPTGFVVAAVRKLSGQKAPGKRQGRSRSRARKR